jgi:hypothetical protein
MEREPPRCDCAAALADLRTDLRVLQRDLDDLDDTVRRLRGRKVKTEALDAALNDNRERRLPTIAELRATGRLPWRT